MTFKELNNRLEECIKQSYEEGISMVQAERLAGEFLYAQMKVSDELKKADLDSRMRKSGVKAIRASVYLDECQKSDKKPTESTLASLIDSNSTVLSEQTDLDEAEVSRDELRRILDVYTNAHIHFRAIAKGGFGS